MTANPLPAADDPRRLLSDMRALAGRVRADQRLTWAALLVLAVLTLVAIPFDWFGMWVNCQDDGCQFARNGMLWYWSFASVVAYAVIAFLYLRSARERGVGARVLPYAITGAATALVFPAAWFAVAWYLDRYGVPEGPLPYWWFALDRLVMPWGMIGVSLLVLAWLERNRALLLFTVGYLALVVLVLPMNDGLRLFGWGIRTTMAVPQVIVGVVLLLAAYAFRRRQR